MTSRRFVPAMPILLLIAACSDDLGGTGPGEPTLADLAGTYEGRTFTYTRDTDGVTVDLLAGSGTLVFTMSPSGVFAGDLFAPFLDDPNVQFEGIFDLEGGESARIDFMGSSLLVFTDFDISFEFSPPDFVWTATDVMFDFTGSNDPAKAVPADLTITLVEVSS